MKIDLFSLSRKCFKDYELILFNIVMVNKIRVSAYALFLFGIVFLFMFRMNLTGNVTQDINDGEKVYHGVVSGIYLTIGVFVLLVGVFVFLYYRYNERVDRNLISFFDYLRGKAEA